MTISQLKQMFSAKCFEDLRQKHNYWPIKAGIFCQLHTVGTLYITVHCTLYLYSTVQCTVLYSTACNQFDTLKKWRCGQLLNLEYTISEISQKENFQQRTDCRVFCNVSIIAFKFVKIICWFIVIHWVSTKTNITQI